MFLFSNIVTIQCFRTVLEDKNTRAACMEIVEEARGRTKMSIEVTFNVYCVIKIFCIKSVFSAKIIFISWQDI